MKEDHEEYTTYTIIPAYLSHNWKKNYFDTYGGVFLPLQAMSCLPDSPRP